MRKQFLTGLLVCILATPGLSQAKKARPRSTLSKEIIGVWALLDKPTGTVSAGSRLKFIMDGHWSMTQADSMSHVTVFHHGGIYTLADSTYREIVGYANTNTAGYIGTETTFLIRIQGDRMHLTGIGNPWNEVWKRLR